MRLFHCDQCGHIVFFESVQCVHCGALLAGLPDRKTVGVLTPAPTDASAAAQATPAAALFTHLIPANATAGAGTTLHYRLCANRTQYSVCNFAVPVAEPHTLCSACRQTLVVPDLSQPGNVQRWRKLETAKRALYYTLSMLGLHPESPLCSPRYQFLADAPDWAVITGHMNGVITINVAEADDDERVRRRVALHEPYRTLLGHLRHESGHFFWDLLIRDGEELASFRALFGDEQQDYQESLNRYYAQPPSYEEWSAHGVSPYARSHPWEDWAESWAHYLHMVDVLETASSYHTRLAVPDTGLQHTMQVQDPFATPAPSFDDMVAQWVPVTLLLNSLNRSLGQLDAYPFALSAGALQKLRYVHDVVQRQRSRVDTLANMPPANPLA